jgi:uncharacterized protein (TIGR03437 family)
MQPRFRTFLALIVFGACGLAQTPVVDATRIYNSASFAQQPVAPGSIVSIFGTNLASSLAQAGSIPLSTQLANVTVTVNNLPAPLFFVAHGSGNGNDQINLQLPWESAQVIPPGTTNGTVQIVVTNNNVKSAPVNVQVSTSAPGIFAVRVDAQNNYITDGTGTAIAYGNLDGIIAAAAGALPGLTTHPAKINDPNTLAILATGLGPLDIPVPSGNNANDGQVHRTVVTPDVLVGNVPAQVVFSGMSPQFVGVYQLNIIIQPGTPTGDAVPLQIRMNGFTTTNKVTIAVSN